MIVIEHPPGLREATSWKERLDGISVSYVMVASEIAEAKLTEGDKQPITGTESITTFLYDYEQSVAGWNQDRCDMWFFDEE